MSQPYAIMRLTKHHCGKTMRAAADHMIRQRETPNADPARMNRWLTPQVDPCQAIQERIESAGVKVRKNAVHAIEFLLTASPEYFRPESPEQAGYWEKERLEAWVPQASKWLEQTFGKDNVVSSVLHLDEATPHISAFVVPIVSTDRGDKLSAKHWCDGRKALAKLQDSYADTVKEIGLRRGIRGSTAKHVRISQFYGSMNSSVPFKLVRIQPPPRFSLNPKEWADTESKRIALVYAKQTRPAREAKEELDLAKRQLKETRATLTRLEGFEKIADRVRDIPLQRVAAALDLAPVPGDPSKYKGTNCTLSLNSTQFYDHRAEQGGGGAIDLVMYVCQANFKEAVAWLADTFGVEAAAAASMASKLRCVKDEVAAAQKASGRPYLPPSPDAARWPHVREWLVQTRCIPEHLVDLIYEKGALYADARGNLCALAPERCCEIKGTGREKFSRLATGSRPKEYGSFRVRRGNNPDTLVLVESALDVMAYAHLHGQTGYQVVSAAGARGRLPWAEAEAAKGRKINCAYDNDAAGEEAFLALRSAMPSITREVPDYGIKDWNDVLMEPVSTPETGPFNSMG